MSNGVAPERRRLDRDFLTRSRIRGYASVAGNLGVFIGFLGLAANTGAIWQYVLAFFAIGCMQHRLFFPTHDCIHYSLFSSRGENSFFGALLSSALGTSFEAIRVQHMDHHREFGKPEDPGASDYYVRFHSRGEFLFFIFGPLVGDIFFRKVGDYVMRSGKAGQNEQSPHDDDWTFKSGLRSYGLIIGVQLAICALLTSGFQSSELWRYPVLYALPLVTLSLFFIRLRMFLEHGSLNYEVCDYFEGKRPTTRTIYASPAERIFLCGNSFNFHNEHHRYPTVPGWQLPGLHRELAPRIDPEDIRQTYVQAFRELWHNLPAKRPH
jgi:fatty acid desaturase